MFRKMISTIILSSLFITFCDAALGIGMHVEDLTEMARSRVLVHLDSLKPNASNADSNVICDSLSGGPWCFRGDRSPPVCGFVPASLHSGPVDENGLLQTVLALVKPYGEQGRSPVPSPLPPRPSEAFQKQSWSAGEGDLDWLLHQTQALEASWPEESMLGEQSAVRQGAFEVLFAQPVVLTSLRVRVPHSGGYVLARAVTPGEDSGLRWWCVITEPGDHDLVEVARRLSAIPARWGAPSVPVDGLDVGKVTFHTNQLVKILSIETVVEGPPSSAEKETVLVLSRHENDVIGLKAHEGVVGPRAPYVDLATVMTEKLTWKHEKEELSDAPAVIFTMERLRRTLMTLGSPDNSCCFCGDSGKDASLTAKNLVTWMEHLMGTRWGRHGAANIDCFVEFAVVSAPSQDLSFLNALVVDVPELECGCAAQQCYIAPGSVQKSMKSLMMRLDRIEKAFYKSGDVAGVTSRRKSHRGVDTDEDEPTSILELYEPYSHHRSQRESSSGISANELLDFLEDMVVQSDSPPPQADIRGWKRRRNSKAKRNNRKR